MIPIDSRVSGVEPGGLAVKWRARKDRIAVWLRLLDVAGATATASTATTALGCAARPATRARATATM